MADRLAISDVLHTYARGIDNGDLELTVACFAEDARYLLAGQWVEGRPALRRHLSDSEVRRRITGLDRVDRFSHAVTNIMIDLDLALDLDVDPGLAPAAPAATAATPTPTATATSMILATVTGSRDGGQVMLVRTICYSDRLVRRDGAWRIVERHHELQWMFETVPTMVLAPAAAAPAGGSRHPEEEP